MKTPAIPGTAILLSLGCVLFAQKPATVLSDGEKRISGELRGLRRLPDDARAGATRELALQIRALPAASAKLTLAGQLANLATEGDFGTDALREVATTLAGALREQPVGQEASTQAYSSLAQLVRYEHAQVACDSPQFAAAMARLEADDAVRARADFTLKDLEGRPWTLRALRGKVVLVNFWATWCPPCRKEIPDLEALYTRFKDQGLVILAISDEDKSKVTPFVAGQDISYPVLLDSGRKVNQLFRVEGIPKSFVYDRDSKLVAQAIDMRTRRQFLNMLSQAGLK